jgi:hypothetical protein
MSSSIGYVMQYIVSSGPTLLVAVVGLLLTFLNWSKLGRAALPAAGGFGLFLLSSLGSFLVTSFLRMQMVNAPGSTGGVSSMATYFGIVGVINGALHAFALACLLVAIMTPRTPPQ